MAKLRIESPFDVGDCVIAQVVTEHRGRQPMLGKISRISITAEGITYKLRWYAGADRRKGHRVRPADLEEPPGVLSRLVSRFDTVEGDTERLRGDRASLEDSIRKQFERGREAEDNDAPNV